MASGLFLGFYWPSEGLLKHRDKASENLFCMVFDYLGLLRKQQYNNKNTRHLMLLFAAAVNFLGKAQLSYRNVTSCYAASSAFLQKSNAIDLYHR